MNSRSFPRPVEKNHPSKVPLGILCLLALMVFDGVFSSLMSSDDQDRTIIHFFRFSLSLVYLSYILFLNDFFIRRLLPLERVLTLFIPWSLFSAILISPDRFLALMEVSRYIYWTLVFSFVYAVVRRYPQTVQYICFFLAVSTVYYLMETITKRGEMIDHRGSQKVGGINASYSLIFIYPWLLIYQRKWIKFLGMLAVCGGILISYKRGAILTLFIVIGMTVFSGVLIYRGKKLFNWVVTNVFFGLFLTLFGIYIFSNLGLAEGYEYRMQDIDSGRREIYEDLFNSISRSSTFEVICGHGLLSTVRETGYVAHNDWLEAFYGLGIVGLAMFTWIHFCILVLLFRLYQNKAEYFIPCFAGYTIFFCRALTGGWLHYTSFAYFLALIAIAYASSEREYWDNFSDDGYKIRRT